MQAPANTRQLSPTERHSSPLACALSQCYLDCGLWSALLPQGRCRNEVNIPGILPQLSHKHVVSTGLPWPAVKGLLESIGEGKRWAKHTQNQWKVRGGRFAIQFIWILWLFEYIHKQYWKCLCKLPLRNSCSPPRKKSYLLGESIFRRILLLLLSWFQWWIYMMVYPFLVCTYACVHMYNPICICSDLFLPIYLPRYFLSRCLKLQITPSPPDVMFVSCLHTNGKL